MEVGMIGGAGWKSAAAAGRFRVARNRGWRVGFPSGPGREPGSRSGPAQAGTFWEMERLAGDDRAA